MIHLRTASLVSLAFALLIVPGASFAQVTTNTQCYSITHNLYFGKTDATTDGQVSALQKFLLSQPAAQYSIGVTGYFGPATEQAVQNWQAANGIVSSGTPDTTGYGAVGPSTRAAINRTCGTVTTVPTTNTDSATAHLDLKLNGSDSIQTFDAGDPAVLSWNISGAAQNCQIYYPSKTGGALRDVDGRGSINVALYPATFVSPYVSLTCNDATGNVLKDIIPIRGATLTGTPSASIDYSSLVSSSNHPVITGSAVGSTHVTLAIRGYIGGSASVIGGRWSIAIADSLPAGTYGLQLTDDSTHIVLTTATLTVQSATSGSVNATIDTSSLTASAGAVTVTGSATNVARVQLNLDGATGGSGVVQTSVIGGRWSATFWSVGAGNHSLVVSDNDGGSNYARTLASATLVVRSSSVPSTSAPTCTLTASRTTIPAGNSTVLSWNAQNATLAVLDYNGAVTVPTSGTIAVSPLTTHTYTLAVQGPGGTTNCTANVVVASVNPAPTCTLTASPTSVTAGSPSTLSWNITNAATGVLDYNGAVTVPASGVLNVSPFSTHTYTLAAQGTGGTTSCTATVSVGTTPAPTTNSSLPDLIALVYGPVTATVGQQVTITGYITNNGTGGTGTSFNSVFLTNLNDTKTDWNTKNVVSIPALPGNIVYPVSTTFTWNAPGTYEYALCADSSTVWAGTITESDKSNNCSAHKTIVVSSTQANAGQKAQLASAIVAVQGQLDTLYKQLAALGK